MTPQIIDFLPAHLGEGNEADGEFKKKNGEAWTAVLGEQIVTSAGMIFTWGKGKGVGEAWIYPSWQRDCKLALWFHRTIKRKLAEVVTKEKLWRVQAYTLENDRQGRAWLERLGFLPAGVDFHYTPQAENTVRFYRIYRENLPWTQ